MRAPLAVAALSLTALATIAACTSNDGASSAPAPIDSLTPNGDLPACAAGAGGTAGGPSPRGDAAGALDSAAKRFVVFGGDTAVPICGGTPGHTHVGDTRVLDLACGGWKQVESPGPSARARHAMAADPSKNRALLFGGRSREGSTGAYTLFQDTWSFDFATDVWSEVSTTGKTPSARANAAIVVDTKGRELVVFGGSTSTSGTAFTPQGDTFVLDLETREWREVASGSGPPARLFHAMALDAQARVAYLFSGGDANAFTGPFLRDTWALDLKSETWTKLATAGEQPLGRINHAASFDESEGKLVVFGGHDDGAVGNQNDVYLLDVRATPAIWTRLPTGDRANKPSSGQCLFPADFTTIDARAPERRSAFAFAARADGRGFAIFGGKSDCGLLADAWWFSNGARGWTSTQNSPIGLSCLRIATTCTGLCG